MANPAAPAEVAEAVIAPTDTTNETTDPDIARAPTMTYKDCHARVEDVLQQRYEDLHRRHRVDDPANVHTSAELYALAVTSSNITPKVCLCHTSVMGKPVVEVIHRLFIGQALPLIQSLARTMLRYGSYALLPGQDLPQEAHQALANPQDAWEDIQPELD